MIYQLINPVIQKTVIADLVLAIPRILCGILLAFNFGGSKFGVPWSPDGTELAFFQVADWFPKDVQEFGGLFAMAPWFFAWIAAFSEAVGGIFLIIGLKTRLFSFLIACTMLVAIIFQKWGAEVWHMLPALGFLWVALQGVVLGSGRFGFDYLISKKLMNWPKNRNMRTAFLSIFVISFCLLMPSKSQAKITEVFFQVDMNHVNNVNKVTVRGDKEPLSWNKDFILSDDDNDGIFTGKVKIDSPYRYLRFKFLNDGDYELMDGENRYYDLSNNKSDVYRFNEYLAFTAEELDKLVFSETQIEEDIAVLAKTLKGIHPALYNYMSRKDFEANLAELEKELKQNPNLSNAYLLISQFLEKIKCSHTFSNPYNQGILIKKAFFYQKNKLPISFVRAENELLINRNVSENPKIRKGQKIISINGVKTEEILNTLKNYISSDGNNVEKKLQRLTMSGTAKVELFDLYYSLVYGIYDSFQLELQDYNEERNFITSVNAISKYERDQLFKKKYNDFTSTFESGLSFEILDDKLGKMVINTFADYKSDFDFEAFVLRSIEEMNEKGIEHFVIDIRENEGGSTKTMEFLLKQVIQEKMKVEAPSSYTSYKKLPESLRKYVSTWDNSVYNHSWKVKKNNIGGYKLRSFFTGRSRNYKPTKNGFKGKVYLLTSAENSSATHIMATYVKKYNLATIVGQETGGNQRGLNGGNIFFTRLPNTSIEIDIPIFHIELTKVNDTTPDGGILPDYQVVRKAESLAKGIDQEMKKVWEMINQ